MITWVQKIKNIYEATVDGYVLRAEELGLFNFVWEVWKDSKIIEMGDIQGDCTTLRQAKDRSRYRMEKHKNNLIRKTVNS